MTSRQDKTRSPAPNELARLYQLEAQWEQEVRVWQDMVDSSAKHLREVRAAIKRACGDKETVI